MGGISPTSGVSAVVDLSSAQGTLAIANGGTGEVTAAAAFGALKQAASETATGVVELATNAECVTGTDATRVVTPAGLTARLAAPGAIGGTTPGAATFTTLTTTGNSALGDASTDTHTLTGLTTLTATTGSALLTLNNVTAGKAALLFQSGGSTKAAFGLSGAVEGDSSVDAAIFCETGGGLRIYTNGSATEQATFPSGGGLTITSGRAFQVGTAYGAEALVATGGIQIKDSAGTSYKLLAVAA